MQYWNGSKFMSNQAACQTDPARSDDVQELTIAGTAPGANDQLNFTVANPNHLAPPPAAKVVFTQEPGAAADGAPLSPQPTVSVEDATGDLSITNSSITLGIASQPVGGNATLTCSGTGPNGLTMTAPNGVANFSGCYIVGKIGFYTLSATAAGLTGDTSTTFQVSVGRGRPVGVYQPTRRRAERRRLGPAAAGHRRGYRGQHGHHLDRLH